MIEIYVDNYGGKLDVDEQTKVQISLSHPYIQKIEQMLKRPEFVFSVPVTSWNIKRFNYAYEPQVAGRFNDVMHSVIIREDSVIIFMGSLYLCKTSYRTAENSVRGRFHLAIKRPSGWADVAAVKMFNEIPIEFNTVLSGTVIQQSWTWSNPVKFLPVRRDAFVSIPCSGTLMPIVQIIPPENYHPFIHVKSIMERVIADAGYKVESEFMNEPMFDSLYMSGNYILRDRITAAIKKQQDFCAGKFVDSVATANSYGMVFASAMQPSNSLGGIVDTANPKELGPDGMTVDGVYNTNDCFQKRGGLSIFKTTVECMVGIEYNISYTSQYKIVDRKRLKGFDTLQLHDGSVYNYMIPNIFEDKRGALESRLAYNIVVLEHSAGEYRFFVDTLDNANADLNDLKPSDHSLKLVTSFSGRSAKFSMPNYTTKILGCELQYRQSSYYPFAKYTKDWAVYYGMVEEQGSINVGMIVRSPYVKMLPSSQLSIDNIIFSGADPGMKITLGRATRVRPVFIAHPSTGSKLKFADVASHEVRQIKVFEAVQHMFNLRFDTDYVNKVVRIEPRDRFYSQDTVDWTKKVDLEKPIEIEDMGLDQPKKRKFRYCDGDGAVARLNTLTQSKYASWSVDYRTVTDNRELLEDVNPLFTPTISISDEMPSGLSAKIIQVGDREQHEDVLSEDLRFPPKIVSYQGLVQLPKGELWGYPSYSDRYPYLTFLDTALQVSLCYNDEQGVAGLHKHYDMQIEQQRAGVKIRMYMNLKAEDVEPFVDSLQMGANFKSLFLVAVSGETWRLRLEEIVDYNPQSADSTLCVFFKEM